MSEPTIPTCEPDVGGSAWNVFLSYHGADRPLARRVRDALEEAGLRVWFDERSIGPGEVWMRALEEGVAGAAAFVVLLTDGAPRAWVQAECDLAVRKRVDSPGFPIVPLVAQSFPPAELGGFLGRYQAVTLPADPAEWAGPLRTLAERLLESGAGETGGRDQRPTTAPFPGLMAFDEAKAHFFFGRSEETRACLARLGERRGGHGRWLQIDGPSGCGKSSLARAGLVPAVRRGEVQGAAPRWRVAVLQPGPDPVEALGVALARALGGDDGGLTATEAVARLGEGGRALRLLVSERLPRDAALLLVVDQLEEVFTAGAAPAVVRCFDGLLAGALRGDAPLYLVTTVRSDMVVRFAELPDLAHELNEVAERFFLEPMAGNALREAVEGPAALAGLSWEEGLAERLVRDTQEASGGLPLLGHVLRALWERRDRLVAILNQVSPPRRV